MLLRQIALLELDGTLISDIANEIELGYRDRSDGANGKMHHDATPEPIDVKHKPKIEKYILDDDEVTSPELKNLLQSSSKNEISAMVSKVQTNAILIRREFIARANVEKSIMTVLNLRKFASAHAFNDKTEIEYATSYPGLESKVTARLTSRSGPEILLNLADPVAAKNSVQKSLRNASDKAIAELGTVTDKTKTAELLAATKNTYADIIEFMFVYMTIEKRCAAIQKLLATSATP